MEFIGGFIATPGYSYVCVLLTQIKKKQTSNVRTTLHVGVRANYAPWF